VPSLPISLHRSPFASAKFTDLPFQIPPYRKMAKKPLNFKILNNYNLNLYVVGDLQIIILNSMPIQQLETKK
jgi:hypothetical protein